TLTISTDYNYITSNGTAGQSPTTVRSVLEDLPEVITTPKGSIPPPSLTRLSAVIEECGTRSHEEQPISRVDEFERQQPRASSHRHLPSAMLRSVIEARAAELRVQWTVTRRRYLTTSQR
ncbi:hypothetical protein BaRGS_00003951, partial [Batillaria attramentaria]